MSTPISRRSLLRTGGGTTLALLLAACGTDPAPTATPSDPFEGLADGQSLATQALQTAGIDVAATLTPIVATFEVLTGEHGRVPFGVLGPDQRPILDADVQVWVVRDGELIEGPISPRFYGEGLGDRGVYIADVQLDTAGFHDLVVQVDGDAAGQAALAVVDPADSTTYPPGSTFPNVVTPTTADPGKLETLCTQDPPCTMHDVSLDAVLGTGAIVLSIATPQFCQTAVCGPVVSVVEGVRDDVAREDVTFIHAEVYNDAGVTTTDAVNELGLPSEPWTWVIGPDGVVVDRFDGPVVPELLADAIGRTGPSS